MLDITSSSIAPDHPVVGSLRALLEKAPALQASDIHLEPQASHLCVRLRIDGVLHIHESPPLAWPDR